MFLAIKEIKKEKRKFLLIISIVVLLSYLVFFLMGLAYGLAKDNRTAIDLWKAENIVLQKGSNKNIQLTTLKSTGFKYLLMISSLPYIKTS